MDWTTFGTIITVLAGLVTIGAPIFAVLRAITRNGQRSTIPSQTTRPQGRTLLNRNSQAKPNVIPWYIWVKVIFHTFFSHMIEEPMMIIMYPIGGGLLVGAVYLFCTLLGIPVGWLNDSSLGTRVLLLCTLLVFSLHFSIEFAEHSDELLQQLQEQRAKRKSS